MHYANPMIRGEDPRVLILGTFPSALSREKREYYANPRNRFWRIIFNVFGVPFDIPDYETKKRVLTDNHIALWDTVTCCETDGSLDSEIKNPVYNTGIPGFVRENGIKALLFNGGNAFTFYKRGNGMPENFRVLPSSSPANARMRFEEKLEAWSAALRTYL